MAGYASTPSALDVDWSPADGHRQKADSARKGKTSLYRRKTILIIVRYVHIVVSRA